MHCVDLGENFQTHSRRIVVFTSKNLTSMPPRTSPAKFFHPPRAVPSSTSSLREACSEKKGTDPSVSPTARRGSTRAPGSCIRACDSAIHSTFGRVFEWGTYDSTRKVLVEGLPTITPMKNCPSISQNRKCMKMQLNTSIVHFLDLILKYRASAKYNLPKISRDAEDTCPPRRGAISSIVSHIG